MPFLIRVWIIIITPQIVYIVLFPLDDVWILIILVPRQSSHALWIVLGANEMITIFNYWFKADAMEIAKYALDNTLHPLLRPARRIVPCIIVHQISQID